MRGGLTLNEGLQLRREAAEIVEGDRQRGFDATFAHPDPVRAGGKELMHVDFVRDEHHR